jgi:hypothetical protein
VTRSARPAAFIFGAVVLGRAQGGGLDRFNYGRGMVRHFLLLGAIAATASAATDPYLSLRVSRVCAGRGLAPCATSPVGLNEDVTVQVDGLNNAQGVDPGSLRVFLDGRELPGSRPVAYDVSKNSITFTLKRTPDSRDTWNHLLGSPTNAVRVTRAGVGPPGKPEFATVDPHPTVQLLVVHPIRFWFCAAFVLLALILFIWLARTSNIIRDSGPPDPPPGKRRPYSLARTQMAFWFFMVLSAFILIWAITGDRDTITEQALVLIGIGTGTALGAATIDASKRTIADNLLTDLQPKHAKAAAELAALDAALATGQPVTPEVAEKREQVNALTQQLDGAEGLLHKPISEGLRLDLLTDADGITLHRFQIVVWTIVLGFIFAIGVYQDLSMPQFSTTLLALLGISAGTYLGFKIPERQA